MTQNEKIAWLQHHVPGPYARARAEAEKDLDEQTPVFCFCGTLATGLHTLRCRKFQERMNTCIIQKLKTLLPEK